MKTLNDRKDVQPKLASGTVTIFLSVLLVCCTAHRVAVAAPAARRPMAGDKGAQQILEGGRAVPQADQLASEMDVPALSALSRTWAKSSLTTNFVNTVSHDQPARLAVWKLGSNRGGPIVVCLHGLFGSHNSWKYAAAALANDYEVWLIDLPGCGASDCPEPCTVGLGGYGPTTLAERVLQALEAQLAQRPGARVIIAGHSLGGMVSLRMFSDPALRRRYAGTLAAVEGLALFAPGDVVVTQATKDWLTVLGLNGAKVSIGSATGLLQDAVKESLRAGFCDPSLATRELFEESVLAFRHGVNRRAAQAMLRDAIPWKEFGIHPDWPAIDALETGYAEVKPPCLIVWGRCDETLNRAMGYKIMTQVPDARMVDIPHTMHLLPLENPVVCADLIRQFDHQLRRGTLARARTVQTYAAAAPEPQLAQEDARLSADEMVEGNRARMAHE